MTLKPKQPLQRQITPYTRERDALLAVEGCAREHIDTLLTVSTTERRRTTRDLLIAALEHLDNVRREAIDASR